MVYGLVRPGIPQARYSCDVGEPSVVVPETEGPTTTPDSPLINRVHHKYSAANRCDARTRVALATSALTLAS
jgi:hypothetical protein